MPETNDAVTVWECDLGFVVVCHPRRRKQQPRLAAGRKDLPGGGVSDAPTAVAAEAVAFELGVGELLSLQGLDRISPDLCDESIGRFEVGHRMQSLHDSAPPGERQERAARARRPPSSAVPNVTQEM